MKTKKKQSTPPKRKNARTTKPRKNAAKPAKTAAKKPAAAKPRNVPAKRTKPDIFTGAKEVAITENKIAVTRTVSKNVNGRYEKREVREYHDKTPANMAALDRKLSTAATKKVSVKFK